MSPRHPLVALALLGLSMSAQAVPKVDPQAKALLTQMIAAESALTSYSGTVTVADSQNAQRDVVEVKCKKPGLISYIQSAAGKPLTQAVSDGTTLYVVDYSRKTYDQQATPSQQALNQALNQSGSLLITVMAQPASIPLAQMMQDPHTQSVTLTARNPVADEAVDTVLIRVVGSPTPGSVMTISFQIGQADHLLRGLTFTGVQAGHTMTHTETLSDLQADPALTAADFAFTPPPNIQKEDAPADTQPAMYDPRLKVGADPFPIAATDLSGKPVTLDAYTGKVLMLDFWATWCPPCRGEIPNVVAAYQKYHAQGFDIVGVSLDQANDRAALEKFLVQNHMTWRQVYDGGGWGSALAKQYGVQAIPFSLLIGRDGKIAAVGDSMRGPGLDPAVQAALSQK